jgi:hypothetical protein
MMVVLSPSLLNRRKALQEKQYQKTKNTLLGLRRVSVGLKRF